MKKLLLFTASALCLVGCNSDVKDYTVKGTYISQYSSQGFHEFIFLDDYVQVTFLFDSIDPELGQRVKMVSQCLYEQKKQNVTVYSAYYDVPPHRKIPIYIWYLTVIISFMQEGDLTLSIDEYITIAPSVHLIL